MLREGRISKFNKKCHLKGWSSRWWHVVWNRRIAHTIAVLRTHSDAELRQKPRSSWHAMVMLFECKPIRYCCWTRDQHLKYTLWLKASEMLSTPEQAPLFSFSLMLIIRTQTKTRRIFVPRKPWAINLITWWELQRSGQILDGKHLQEKNSAYSGNLELDLKKERKKKESMPGYNAVQCDAIEEFGAHQFKKARRTARAPLLRGRTFKRMCKNYEFRLFIDKDLMRDFGRIMKMVSKIGGIEKRIPGKHQY